MTDYEKLKKIVDEIEVLISNKVISRDPEFQAWRTKAERFLIAKFGKDSYEHQLLAQTYFFVFSMRDVSRSEDVVACRKGLEKNKAIFLTY